MVESLKASAQAAIDREGAGGPGKKSQSSILVDLAQGVELFHSPAGDAFARVSVNGHLENWLLRSRGFRSWLSRCFFGSTGRAPNAQALQDALLVLDGRARFDAPEHPVHVRLAESEGGVYLDLGDDLWRAVLINADGWEVVADPSVRFRRPRGLLSLPVPQRGGRLTELRRFINVADDDWPLVLGWLVAALRPTGPYPVLSLHGEQGSAKTTLALLLRALVDPNEAPVRAEPKDPRDLAIAANNAWCIAFDNLSHIPGWLSDGLCRLATGGGFATRTLYENDEETIFSGQRPVILTGITELATRGDLLDRSIILHLPSIAEDRRRSEATLWQEFNEMAPRLLGALLDAVATALSNQAKVRLEGLPRMADFAIWVVAASPALGMAPKEFLDAYTGNREAANESALEVSPVTAPLLALVQSGGWEGTATELLKALSDKVDERTQRLRGWPRSGRAMSDALRRMAPHLRAVGVEVMFKPRKSKSRGIRLEKRGETASPSSPSSPTDRKASDGRVTMGDAPPPTAETLRHRGQLQGDARDDGDAKSRIFSNGSPVRVEVESDDPVAPGGGMEEEIEWRG